MRTLLTTVTLLGGTAIAAPKAKPTLEHGDATISGDLDATALAKVVRRSSAKLLGCYKKALVIRPGLSGTVTATFTIGADGKVATAETTGLTTSAGVCIAATITKIRFAKPKDGQPVKVTYPLTFDSGAEPLVSSFGNNVDLQGGYAYGRSGFGPGGGGVGWGTIGGGVRGTEAVAPSVSIGEPEVQGDLDKAIIRRYIKRHTQKLAYCYDQELAKTPRLKGTVTAAFTIGGNGNVSTSTASGLASTNVETCIAEVIKAIEFPKPKGGGAVTVQYPLVFQPAAPPAATK